MEEISMWRDVFSYIAIFESQLIFTYKDFEKYITDYIVNKPKRLDYDTIRYFKELKENNKLKGEFINAVELLFCNRDVDFEIEVAWLR